MVTVGCTRKEGDMSSGTGKPFSFTNNRGRVYYLHAKTVELRNHHRQRIYYFASEEQDGVLSEVPDGLEVVENPRTGLPFLRRLRG